MPGKAQAGGSLAARGGVSCKKLVTLDFKLKHINYGQFKKK
jgi:hypothetical protein